MRALLVQPNCRVNLMKAYKNDWDFIWSQNVSKTGLIILNNGETRAFNLMKELLSSKSKILDVGCGTGRTLSLIRSHFPNSIGIDYSETSIKKCKKIRLNVFKMDAKEIKFPINSFDLVYSEGLLEHYNDMSSIVKEMCRVSKEYILLVQPSLMPLKNFWLKVFKRRYVEEIPYKICDYEKEFKKCGFNLIKRKSDTFRFLDILLFKDVKKKD